MSGGTMSRRVLTGSLILALCLGWPLGAGATWEGTAAEDKEAPETAGGAEREEERDEEETGESGTDDGLILCQYSLSGGMENESYSLSLAWEEGECILTSEKRNWEGSRTRKAHLPEETREDLLEILWRYDPPGWEELPEEEFFALDAPSQTLIMIFGDGTIYSVSDSSQIDGKLFREVEDFLESFPLEPLKKRVR